MTDNLVILKKDRAVIRTAVNKYIQQIEEILKTPDLDILNLEESLEQLNETAGELKKIDSDIKILLKENQLEAELQSAQEYREKITTWRFRANRKIKEINKQENTATSTLKQESLIKKEVVTIKLPKLEISKFNGNSGQWLTFWSSFESAIHKNDDLDPVDKFNYLRTYLSGAALKSIEGFAVTSENYFKVIDIITQQYGQKEVLVNFHLNNLLNIHPLKFSNDTKSLRNLYDNIQTQIRSLESLEVSLDSYGNLLTPIIMKLLPQDLVIEFNKENVNKLYNVQNIIDFLFKQLNSRERLLICSGGDLPSPSKSFSGGKNFLSGKQNSSNKSQYPTATDLLVDSKIEKEPKCSFCDESSHESARCVNVQSLSFDEKLNLLRKRGICYRCLKKARHIAKDCTSKVICTCGGRHADIMCNRKTVTKPKIEKSNDNSKQTLSNRVKSSTVHLQTLTAEVVGNNSSGIVRVIIDSGSENSYISKYVANKLNLRKIKSERIKHGLFGGIEFSEEHNRYRFTLSSLDKKFNCKIEALDQEKICTGINSINNNQLIRTLGKEGVYLTDVSDKRDLCMFENNPEEIHLLLGADMAANLFTQNIRHFPNFGLTAFQTKLGWVVMGKTDSNYANTEKSISTLSLSLHVSNCNLTDLWRLDTLGISNEENKTKAILEEETQKHFLETVKRDIFGRYEVSLPWVVDQSVLPSNRFIAEKSLYKTEKKLTNTQNREEYSEIFDFWENNGIIEEVKDEKTDRVHFLPHRPVIKETSETTKIRPVFNASAHIRNSPSLNDCLTKGPNLIEIIPRILNRFRKYRIGVSSDIEKAFLQIKISEKDRDFLRFFWFDNENNLKIYRHCRVVFGLTSSPFLLVATLKHLLGEVPPHLEETARILGESFYIDNSLTSLNSAQDIEKFKQESISILASGHFNLRCWRSNLPVIMNEEMENMPRVAPVLGLMWDLERDNLVCRIDENIKIEEPYTKRKVLSITQKIFDPIGFTAPITLIPKLILQQTWIQKLKWDEELSEDLKKLFTAWIKGIGLLHEIQVPRWLNIDIVDKNKTTLHVFSDASKNAYATCIFIRISSPEGVKVQLVNARSRVSPIKELTIPRLELLSCLIGARLAKTISTDLELGNVKTTFWCDSTTALGWIRREQSWGTYVHNRVKEIRELSSELDWRHVPGNLNPADLPSRGCSFEQLKMSKWWEGPSWLYLPEDQWPQTEEPPDEELINKEKRKTVLTIFDKNKDTDWYYRYFSSYRKLVRMLAWIHRFLYNLKNLEKNLSSDISIDEFEKAEKTLFKLIQKESFRGRNDPKILTLRPFEDENQILRAKTNVIHRIDQENFRYPVILPCQHPVVERLIFEKHIGKQHAGVGTLMSELRENFWILKSRKCIRNVIGKCVKCKRFATSRVEVQPGIPPEDRTRDAGIFEVVGVDLAGPLYLSDGTKAWIALYTCAVYRAIHLELISSLSTESFIQSLRRFIARRGRPYVIYTDNGTNFVGTANALSNLDWDKISSVTSLQKIRWKFNPPSAPWWGGWWERLVRMVKEILRKILGRASLSYEELNTILCDCEQIINSRPLTYVSEDNQDLTPLTPMMFLQELSSSGVPDIDALDSVDLNRRARYRQRIRNDLRSRFRSEYLGQLRQHALKKENFQPLKIGDIVLLEEANKRRISWPLAKVIQLFPGRDQTIRLAKVKTANGIFLRPVQRLFPLEIDSGETVDCSSSQNAFSPNSKTSRTFKTHHDPDISLETRASPKDCASAPTVVTRRGRVIKPPRRFQQ